MPRTCTATIDLQAPVSGAWEGRGFGRRHVYRYRCPSCGAERRFIASSFRGKRPEPTRGAVTCGALLPDPPPVEVSLEESFHVETGRVDLRVAVLDGGPLDPEAAEEAVRAWARRRSPGAVVTFTTVEDL